MIFIFNKNSILISLIARLLAVIKCKVLITSSSKSFFLRQLIKLDIKIADNLLLRLDMSSQFIKDIGLFDGDCNKVSESCVENLYKKLDIIKDLELFFPNVKDLQKKLRLIIYQNFDSLVVTQQAIITWIESSIYKDHTIVNFSPLRPGAKCVWKNSNLRVIFIFNYFIFFINFLIKTISVFTNFLIKKISLKFRNILKRNNLNYQFSENIKFNQNNILFFPHCGVVMNGHPPKDHFYSNQISSAFHPSNIVHLEYDDRVDINLEKERIKKYFHLKNINYKKFTKGSVSLLGIIFFIIKIFCCLSFFKYRSIKSNFLFYYLIVYSYINFKRYRNSLEPFKDAKIALVGYDILFPKELSFALESFNIKTISTIERFSLILTNNYTFSIDTVFSISESVSKKIKDSNRFLVNNIFEVGQVRTDHFFDKEKEILQSEKKARVLVLDFHIHNNPTEQEFEPVLNWKNDIYFRNEILLLAEQNPDIEFIFRGKNYDWYNNKDHHHVKSKVEMLTNVSVDMDYLNRWKSYHLCSSADLVIARPTSLAEECASKGINLIVLDYGINYTTTVTKFLPALLCEYYCYSFKQLNEMFKFWKENGYVIRKELKNKIKYEVFSNLTDGHVKHRIQKYLKKIKFEL